MADKHYSVTELFQDGTVAATNSDGEEKFFGLCVKDGKEPQVYLSTRHWDEEDTPPAGWREQNSLTRSVPV